MATFGRNQPLVPVNVSSLESYWVACRLYMTADKIADKYARTLIFQGAYIVRTFRWSSRGSGYLITLVLSMGKYGGANFRLQIAFYETVLAVGF